MNIHNLAQGSPEWLAHRAMTFNASDAPAMMGESKYKKRSELLHELATGIIKEVDASTRARFDDGHRCEDLARPLAEKIIGEDLYPVVGDEDFGLSRRLGASLDGFTMGEDIIYEHKRLNAELRACQSAADLSLMYRIQMEQQLMVSGAKRVLFMASEWNDQDELIEEISFWYEPDLELRARILDGWRLFEQDLHNYVPVEAVVAPETKPAEALPVPSIVVRGEVTLSNLSEILPEFDRVLANTNTELTTDEHFAQADVDAKASRQAAKNLKLTAKAVIDQIAPVSEAVRTLEEYATKFDALGLKLEKAVANQKDAIKTGAVLNARKAFEAHVIALEVEIQPIRLSVPAPDFAGAIKGIKTIASMNERIGNALVSGKADAEAVARDMRAKLAWFNEHAAEHKFLFNDLQQIITKAADDFQLLVKTRISEHQNEQERRLEAERERIRQEEEAAATARIEAEAAAANKPAPAPAPAPAAVPTPAPAAVAQYEPQPEIIDTGAKVKLGQLSGMIGLTLSAELLTNLGIEPAGRDRAAVLYRESDFPRICQAIVAKVQRAEADYMAGLKKAA